ncbi:peptidase family m13 protein [Colletotrichum plurivorum]|uniref:Peptidase family m13 protein n=1 Tax=Colletotrichum plurivorum TaxID=2175906 RepID=A0A8H6U681_9PEZI|nr:peptidase family m13 protein [Colletotrichum plurivorum]
MAPTNSGVEASGRFCTTPVCLEIASGILSSLAPNYTEIDPCTDFDKLTCAGWQAKNVPRAGRGYASSFDVNADVVLKNILESPYHSGPDAGFVSAGLTEEQIPADQENFKLITDAYNACLNITTIEAVGLQPLMDFIDQVVQAYPVAEAEKDRPISTEDGPVLGEVLLFFARHGISTFESITVEWKDIDPNKMMVSVLPGGSLFLNPDQMADMAIFEEYSRIQAAILEKVHPANISLAEAERLGQAVTEFEKNLLIVSTTDDSRENCVPQTPGRRFTLEEVTSVAPELGHGDIIKTLAPAGYVPDELYFSPGYFGNLSALLANTSSEVVQTFFVWTAVTTLAGNVEDEATERLNDMRATLRGLDPQVVGKAPRWQTCLSHVESGPAWTNPNYPAGLGFILSRFFIDKAYSQEARDMTTALMATIQATFIDRLADKEWMTDEVKKIAEEKVNAVTKKIGYPDASPETANPESLSEYYAGSNISSISFFDNALSMADLVTARAWSYLGKPADKNMWLDTPSSTNAYYFSLYNDIVILAGIQQRPFYSPEYPSYINYGGLGPVLGHELTHGFDNNGHYFAPNGSLANWWDESSEKAFEERAQCFVEQYGNFSITASNGTQIPIPGEFTLGENIADAGGLQTAFAAYERARSNYEAKDFNLPGLEHFSHEQLFFIHYAQTWCEVSASKDYEVFLFTEDVHSPGFARIKGPVANSREFRKAFNCPVKEPTCELW